MTSELAPSAAQAHYDYHIGWSAEDGEFVATVAEFPSLSWLAATPVEALTGLIDLVDGVVAQMRPSGEAIPGPRDDRTDAQ